MKRVSYSDAVGRKYPESVVFVVAPDEEGAPNVMPAGWSMFTSSDPLMIAVSVGLERHTQDLLESADDYVVAFPSAAHKEDIVFCGLHSGADVDKVAESGLELAESVVVSRRFSRTPLRVSSAGRKPSARLAITRSSPAKSSRRTSPRSTRSE